MYLSLLLLVNLGLRTWVLLSLTIVNVQTIIIRRRCLQIGSLDIDSYSKDMST